MANIKMIKVRIPPQALVFYALSVDKPKAYLRTNTVFTNIIKLKTSLTCI